MKKKIVVLILSFVYIVYLFFPSMGYANAENQSNSAPGGFSFEVIQPENQRNKEVTYFDLLMQPGQKQTVQMRMNNSSNKEIKVSIKLNSAKTNSNGVIEYGPNKIPKDKSVTYDFNEIVKAPKEVEIPAGESQLVGFELTMPKSEFNGFVSGGIQLQQVDDEGEKKETESGMVVNKFAYLVGMLLSESELEGIKPDLKLNSVYPELQNFRNAVFINFSNTQPVYTEGMSVNVQINKKNSEEILYETKKNNMRMAPNSMIDFPISMNGEEMKPGTYRANILVTTTAGGKWAWKQEFKITKEDADKFNEQDLSLAQDRSIQWGIISVIIGIVLLLAIVIYLFIRRRQKNKAKKERLKRKMAKKKIKNR